MLSKLTTNGLPLYVAFSEYQGVREPIQANMKNTLMLTPLNQPPIESVDASLLTGTIPIENLPVDEFEIVANKTLVVDASSTDEKYPSALAVNNAIQTESILTEKLSNKTNTITSQSTINQYPTASAVYSLVSGITGGTPEGVELSSNKTTTVSALSTDVEYPSAKAVHTAVATAQTETLEDVEMAYEKLENKVVAMVPGFTDDQYMSAKLVQDTIGELETDIDASEKKSMKSTEIVSTLTDDEYPSTKAVYTALSQRDVTLQGKEDVLNKKTALTSGSTDVEYPSAKAVYTYLTEKENVSNKVNVLDSSATNYPTCNAVTTSLATKESVSNKTDTLDTSSTKYPSCLAVSNAMTISSVPYYLLGQGKVTNVEPSKLLRVRASSVTGTWNGTALSHTGQYRYRATYNGIFYASSDYGATWSQQSKARQYTSAACSGDGRYVIMTGTTYIEISSDYGATQTDKNSGYWTSCCCSTTGQYMYACTTPGTIWASNDYGQSFSMKHVSYGKNYHTLACSGDGNKIMDVNFDGYIYVSTDGGITMTQRAIQKKWSSCCCSTDFAKLYADCEDGIYKSVDQGVTWNKVLDRVADFKHIACSDDGTRIVCGETSGYLKYSMDSGTTWKDFTACGKGAWRAADVSGDGNYAGTTFYGGAAFDLKFLAMDGSQPPNLTMTETNTSRGIKVEVGDITYTPNTVLTSEWELPYTGLNIWQKLGTQEAVDNWATNAVTWSIPSDGSAIKVELAAAPLENIVVKGFSFYRRSDVSINWGFLASTRMVLSIRSLGVELTKYWWLNNCFNQQFVEGSAYYLNDASSRAETTLGTLTDAGLVASSRFSLNGTIDLDVNSLETIPNIEGTGWSNLSNRIIYRPRLAKLELVCNPINCYEKPGSDATIGFADTVVMNPQFAGGAKTLQMYYSHIMVDHADSVYIDLSYLLRPCLFTQMTIYDSSRTTKTLLEGKLDFGKNMTAYNATCKTKTPTKFYNCVMRSAVDPYATIMAYGTTYGFYTMKAFSQHASSEAPSFQ